MLRLVRPFATLIALALGISYAAFGSGDDSTAERKRTVSAPGFELALANGWQRVENQVGEDLRLRASREGGGEATITVSRVADPPPNVTLDQYTERLRQRVLASVPGAELGPTRSSSLTGEPARVYQLTATAQGKEGVVKGLVTLRDGAVYAVVFGSEAGSSRNRDYQEMLKSWKWKAVKASEAPDVKPAATTSLGSRP